MSTAVKKILLLDNFDSFTFNLVDFFEISGGSVTILRNNIPLSDVHLSDFDLLVLSPGPSIPKNAGNLMDIIAMAEGRIPIFGVCLGHEALAEHFGGSLHLVPPMHGKGSSILHDGKTIFTDIPNAFVAGRYHSLAVDSVPESCMVSARTEDNTVMAMRHRTLPIESVQFHPESVLTMKDNLGIKIIENVLLSLT